MKNFILPITILIAFLYLASSQVKRSAAIYREGAALLQVKEALVKKGVNSRRYFHPSLNKLPYHSGSDCPVAEDISSRVLCLPLYYGLTNDQVIQIVGTVLNEI